MLFAVTNALQLTLITLLKVFQSTESNASYCHGTAICFNVEGACKSMTIQRLMWDNFKHSSVKITSEHIDFKKSM